MDKMWRIMLIMASACLGRGQNTPWILESDSMPSDSRLVPGVGNAHVATQVYSDTMYMNDLYSGYTNTSHRARIPSTSSVILDVVNPISTRYSLDMRQGVFFGYFETTDYIYEQRIYAHRSRTRIMINEFDITRRGGAPEQAHVVSISLNQGAPSDDVGLSTVEYDLNAFYTTGPISEAETETSGRPEVHQYWTKVPTSVVLPAGVATRTWSYMTSTSIDQSDALLEFQAASGVSGQELFNEHITAWVDIWNHGDITVQGLDGDTELAQILHAALFHILISTPDQDDVINPFGGLSPGGLARGGQINNLTSSYNDYLGHVFWDMDTWILPSILMFHPEKARLMIASRYRVIDAARDNAIETGNAGIRFPWEQGYSGYEVCPWDLAALYQLHVTADVSYSIRQYLYTTTDVAFVANIGKEMAMEIARFWESKSVLLDVEKGYEIHGVMGPDENSANVNNSIFTNYQARLSLSLPQYMADKLNIAFDANELTEMARFNQVADQMYIPFNEELQFHPQYDGFDYINSTIKQSDVVLLGYPLMMAMPVNVRRNDLELYELLTDKFGPDTGTWSMHTVGWLELGNRSKAIDMFQYMFRNINGPFKIFSEKPEIPENTDGMRATNFITLAGGMLQAVIFGFGGVRVRPGQMDMNPTLLPNSTSWAMNGFKYRGSSIDFDIGIDDVTVTLTNQGSGAEDLILLTPGGRDELVVDSPVVVSRGTMTIVTRSEESGVTYTSYYV